MTAFWYRSKRIFSKLFKVFGASSKINTILETRSGSSRTNPSIEEMRAALSELSAPDAKHPAALLEDEEGWGLVVFESGRVLFLTPDSKEVGRSEYVSRQNALALWLLLQQGQRDEIKQKLADFS